MMLSSSAKTKMTNLWHGQCVWECSRSGGGQAAPLQIGQEAGHRAADQAGEIDWNTQAECGANL